MPAVAASAPAFALMGFCEGVTTEPDQGGLIGGICGVSTGAYARRTVERMNELDRLEQIQRGLQVRVDENERITSDLEARIDRLSQRVRSLARRVEDESSAEARARESLASVEGEVSALRAQLANLVEEDRRRLRAGEALAAGQRSAREQRAIAKARQNSLALQSLDAEMSQIDERARVRAGQ